MGGKENFPGLLTPWMGRGGGGEGAGRERVPHDTRERRGEQGPLGSSRLRDRRLRQQMRGTRVRATQWEPLEGKWLGRPRLLGAPSLPGDQERPWMKSNRHRSP